ncbi:hypothetical protein [Geobacter sp.]|uniref:hypothetical protein n=1 Tax=Geobacter sp. TaxID=46610 RepID=UPI0026329258|nr:hypothetical protein [Geobacter sp.]
MKKKLLAVVAAGAVTAATAVPALALENEFHGMFRVKGTISNYNGAGAFAGLLAPSDNPKTKNFVDQRARLMYIAKANDDLKLVTHFEIDSQWGDNSYTVGRNDGGALGADQINLETKNVYLDFNIPAVPVNMKVGMQPFTDAYKGIFINADAAGALATAKYGSFTNALGWFRLDDRGGLTGKNARDLLILDGKYAVNKNLNVGGSYYLYNDDNSTFANGVAGTAQDVIVHTVGVNGEANLGLVTVDGFALYQFGNAGTKHVSAWAANAGAKAKVGIGILRAQFLYTSGEGDTTRNTSNAFVPVTNHTSGANAENTFYPADMRIILRDKFGTTDDHAIIYNTDNQSQGIIGGFIGYDANITPKVFANANAGFVATAKRNTVTESSSKYMGTELNAEVGYKLYDNLTTSLQGAYVILGDYYKGTGGAAPGKIPNDPFLSRVVLNYAF